MAVLVSPKIFAMNGMSIPRVPLRLSYGGAKV